MLKPAAHHPLFLPPLPPSLPPSLSSPPSYRSGIASATGGALTGNPGQDLKRAAGRGEQAARDLQGSDVGEKVRGGIASATGGALTGEKEGARTRGREKFFFLIYSYTCADTGPGAAAAGHRPSRSLLPPPSPSL
jgi:hypothetical protein